MIKAFLLTRQAKDTAKGIELVFWLSSERGPVKVIIHRQKAVLFVRQAELNKAEACLSSIGSVKTKLLELTNFESEKMAAVYFDSQKQFYRALEQLNNAKIYSAETDIRPVERYLTERFLTGPVMLHTASVASIIEDPKITPCEYHPSFRVMSLDIETDYKTGQLYSIAFITRDVKRVLMLSSDKSVESSDEFQNNNIEVLINESALMARFLSWVERLDPDVFIGWNVINFDFRFLQKKADDLRLPLTLGREKKKIAWRQQKNEPDRHFLVIPGRVVLDGIDTLKSATYSFPSYSLETVGQILLGRGKLIHDKNHHDPLYKAKEIQRQFRENKLTFAAYNLEDCQLVWEIFEETDLINFAIERARLTGLEMDRMGGSVAAFDNLYLPRLHRKGYIAPNIGDYEERLSAPGGYVMNSQPGMHNSVLVLDYKSLYPSIIRTFKVDPYGRLVAKNSPESDVIPGYDGATFSKKDHILPEIIKNLWQARDQAKRDKNKALSQAIKIIMNSFYGVLGTPGCRIHDSRLTSSITKRSHDVILKTVEIIENEGYSLIYGDTDSVFVALNVALKSNNEKPLSNAAAKKIGQQLVNKINAYWLKSLKETYGITSYLEMEYETHYSKFFMPTIRGSEKGSKKRYAGMVIDDSGNKTLVFKGLETVRTDWTLLARNFQRMLYDKIFNEQPYEADIRQIVDELKRGAHDTELVYRKRLRKKLADYQKNIPPHAQAAIKAEKYFLENRQPSRYKQVSWIEYVITLNGAEVMACQTARLDYQHYIDKQLTPIADAILQPLGQSMEMIIQDQYSLF